jgi:retron-type reverse transcriptase
MKRHGNLFDKVIAKQNILTAIQNSSKNKNHRNSVKRVKANISKAVDDIHNLLKENRYQVSQYAIDPKIERGKLRELYKLPYYPDRIIQHALIQVVEPILNKVFIDDTYQSIKGRGCHKAKRKITKIIKNEKDTKYILKIDIEKYYPNVKNNILKAMLKLKIKCKATLGLLFLIIDSVKGLAIGNYISQMLGNFYLAYFDHWVKEVLRIKNYIRYADDMVFMLDCKKKLAEIKAKITGYLKHKLKIKVKGNWQIFPFISRGLDFLGFRFFKGYTLLRKSIKKAYIKVVNKIVKNKPKLNMINSIMSYYGWLKHTNAHNLIAKTITSKVKEKIDIITKMFKISNPISKINTYKPKRQVVRYYQPTLF